MRTTRWLTVMALLVSATARGQGTPVQQHQATTPPLEARFEIIQSSFVAKLTIRLDRVTGATDQLVSRADSSIGWQPLVRRTHRERDIQVLNRPSYQIFTSGITAKFTFLWNVNTGATWQLVEDPDTGWFWTPIF